MAFPWLEIRKNEAYPVFTNTSSDQHDPWTSKDSKPDESGQINAFFRWKTIKDTKNEFAIELRLAKKGEFDFPVEIPKESTADVTLRRLQSFKVAKDRKYFWKLMRNSSVAASGQIRPDLESLLTIPRIRITNVPAQLRMRSVELPN